MRARARGRFLSRPASRSRSESERLLVYPVLPEVPDLPEWQHGPVSIPDPLGAGAEQ